MQANDYLRQECGDCVNQRPPACHLATEVQCSNVITYSQDPGLVKYENFDHLQGISGWQTRQIPAHHHSPAQTERAMEEACIQQWPSDSSNQNQVGHQYLSLNSSSVFPSPPREPNGTPPERIIQRVKANKKERRRTQSINQAFSELRRHIPDVPIDTKLSKIKTLRLAISYISHLMSTLDIDARDSSSRKMGDCLRESGAQLTPTSQTNLISKLRFNEPPGATNNLASSNQMDKSSRQRDRKHRTGWPEIIWKHSSGIGLNSDMRSTK